MCVWSVEDTDDVFYREKMKVTAMNPELATEVDDDRVSTFDEVLDEINASFSFPSFFRHAPSTLDNVQIVLPSPSIQIVRQTCHSTTRNPPMCLQNGSQSKVREC